MNLNALRYPSETSDREVEAGPKRREDRGLEEKPNGEVSVSVVASEPIFKGSSTNSSLTDEDLLGEITGGSEDALAALFRRYARLVRALGLRILRDHAEADDLLQEVFLQVHETCSRFDPAKGSARSWLVQLTYCRAIDRRRYLASRRFYSLLDIEDARHEPAASNARGYGAEWSLESVLGRATSEGLKRRLTPDQLATIRLYFFEGYTLEEVAGELGQSLGNVRNHYYRGLERMRQLLFTDRGRGNR